MRRRVQSVFSFVSLPAMLARVSEVTHILDRVQQGDSKAAEELLPLVYAELRRLAAHKMANETPGQTLQPTALVHEAWMRPGRFDPSGMARPRTFLQRRR
jgi:hypothetical protein